MKIEKEKSGTMEDVLQVNDLLDLPEDNIHAVYIKSLSELVEMQKQNIKDKYNAGLYNGLAIAYAMAIGKEPRLVDIRMIGGN